MNQSEKALMELRNLVLSGELVAGKRLYEVAISDRLGISRTPVRDALNRLEQEGLLERASASGFTVRSFSFNDVIDAIELRGVLEGTAARIAAERGANPETLSKTKQILSHLDSVIEAGPESLDFEAYSDLNDKLHTHLASLAGSSIISREVERASRLPFASPGAFIDAQSDILEFRQSLILAQSQHRNIVEAIESREGTRAEHISREHARLARKNLEYVMNQDRNKIIKVPGLALVTR